MVVVDEVERAVDEETSEAIDVADYCADWFPTCSIRREGAADIVKQKRI